MKKNILTIILNTVFIVVFNTLFFLNGGTQHIASIWITYGFLHFAYLMVLITPLITSLRGSYPVLSQTIIYIISLLYFVIELFFAIVSFVIKTQNIKLIVSIEIIITGLYAIILIINLLTDNSIVNKQQHYESENNFIKGISAQIKYIESIVTDKYAKSKLESLYYLVHSSPSKSSDSVRFYENEIMRSISVLDELVANNNISDIIRISKEIEKLVNKRNFELKMMR